MTAVRIKRDTANAPRRPVDRHYVGVLAAETRRLARQLRPSRASRPSEGVPGANHQQPEVSP